VVGEAQRRRGVAGFARQLDRAVRARDLEALAVLGQRGGGGCERPVVGQQDAELVAAHAVGGAADRFGHGA
jgi:hypothetical protein